MLQTVRAKLHAFIYREDALFRDLHAALEASTLTLTLTLTLSRSRASLKVSSRPWPRLMKLFRYTQAFGAVGVVDLRLVDYLQECSRLLGPTLIVNLTLNLIVNALNNRLNDSLH